MHVHVLKFVIIIIDLIIVCLARNNYYIHVDAWYCYEVISLIQHTALIGLV